MRREHFSARAIGWGDKALGIEQVAGSLRIGIDAVAFIDDNPGELAAVATRWPGLQTIHAEEDAGATRRLLDWYPGLWAWSVGEADALRVADLGAAAVRAREMEASADPREYLESLQVRLDFAANPRAQLGRLVELSQKTNQFNLNLGRIGEVDMAGRLGDRGHRVVSIRLRDRLADSGIIGLICGRREGDALVIDELCISCRALGRNWRTYGRRGDPVDARGATRRPCRIRAPERAPQRAGPAMAGGLLGRPLAGEHGREAVPSARWTADRADLPVEINRELPDADESDRSSRPRGRIRSPPSRDRPDRISSAVEEPAWDSLKHIEIMFALEDRCDVRFSQDELASLDRLSAIVERVKGHTRPLFDLKSSAPRRDRDGTDAPAKNRAGDRRNSTRVNDVHVQENLISPPISMGWGCSSTTSGSPAPTSTDEAARLAILGYRAEADDFADPVQGIRGRFLIGPGPRLELLAPLPGRDVLDPWLKAGVKLYHLAYEVTEMDAAIALWSGAGSGS